MANRRMFSKAIIESDLFIEMPLSTQALYFHLGINGDDDGFVSSPKRIMRSLGCKEDDFKILQAKGFVKAFESGVVVITHWNEHNFIRKDRYVETIHQDEKQQLQIIDLQDNTALVNQVSTTCPPRLVEVRVSKKEVNSVVFDFSPKVNTACEEFKEHIKTLGKGFKKTDKAWTLFKNKVTKFQNELGEDGVIELIDNAIEGNWKTLYPPKANSFSKQSVTPMTTVQQSQENSYDKMMRLAMEAENGSK